MKRYFIETSTIVNFLRSKKGAIETIEKFEGELTSSFVCLAELYEGVCRVKNTKKAEKGVLMFFSGLSEIFGLDNEIAKKFGQIRAKLKREGERIEDLDIFIAATCLAYNLELVTYNAKHFARVENLKILDLG